MKRIVFVGLACFAVAFHGCQKQEEKQPITYAPATPPAVIQIDEFEQAARESPKSAEAWTRLGDVLMDSQRYNEAIDAYEKALTLNPKNVNVLVDQGTCYRGIGKFDMAVKRYRQALKLNPDFPNGHRNLGVVLAFDLHKTEEGRKELQRYLELVPNDPAAESIRQALRELPAEKH